MFFNSRRKKNRVKQADVPLEKTPPQEKKPDGIKPVFKKISFDQLRAHLQAEFDILMSFIPQGEEPTIAAEYEFNGEILPVFDEQRSDITTLYDFARVLGDFIEKYHDQSQEVKVILQNGGAEQILLEDEGSLTQKYL